MMYLITYKGRSITLKRLYELEKKPLNIDEHERQMLIAAPTRKAAVDIYLHYIGFTWKERRKGLEIHAAIIVHTGGAV